MEKIGIEKNRNGAIMEKDANAPGIKEILTDTDRQKGEKKFCKM